MPSLDEFKTLLDSNADEAFRQYSLLIDYDQLDFNAARTAHDEFKSVTVTFVYSEIAGNPVILMTPAADGRKMSYLPWKNASEGAIAKITLNDKGPNYFSTSQLDGCRFALQYHDTDHRVVTVQHLAGDVAGTTGKAGTAERDRLEALAAPDLPATATPDLRRRLSVGRGVGKNGRIGATFKASRPDTTYYDGGKAAVFGYRNKSGAWVFYEAETDEGTGRGVGLKNLWTKTAVTGSLKADGEL